MKKQTRKNLFTFAVCGGLLLLGAVLTGMIPLSTLKPFQNQPGFEDKTHRDKLHKTLKKYFDSVPEKQDWWMQTVPPPDRENAFQLAHALTNVNRALERARSVSPQTEEIAKEFNTFFTSVFENGHARITREGKIDRDSFAGKTEICFFSQEDYVKGLPALLFFRDDWKAVMMAGVNWSHDFFSAVLMHELNHALKDKRHAKLVPGSKPWIVEEVESHELEALVLDHLTKGEYFPTIEAILNHHTGAKNAASLMSKLSKEDFERLDRVIGLETRGATIRSSSCAQHVIILGFRFIDRQKGGLDEKIRFYEYVTGRS